MEIASPAASATDATDSSSSSSSFTAPIGDLIEKEEESNGASSSSVAARFYEEEDEGDVCRICRNSGDADNPLQYPCACSGSIKFVHQDCLLQWLNHSNARQCEILLMKKVTQLKVLLFRELIALVVQLSIITFTLSQNEKPVWPLRIWILGYDIGCLLSLLLLYGRYLEIYAAHGDGFSLPDLEQQRSNEESRYSHLMNKCRTSLELFYAIWFVMGNVWMFDSRFDSFDRAPKLHVLYISLVSWNALCYSFPFLLFLLLGCCVPLVSTLLGYNMNMASVERGATDDQISNLPSWKYNALDNNLEIGNSTDNRSNDMECCICLAKYKDEEEVRELPCSHMFHLNCVDQWLRIISCCPLCKQELER